MCNSNEQLNIIQVTYINIVNIRGRMAWVKVSKMFVVGSPVSVVDCCHPTSDVLLDEPVNIKLY